MSSAKVRRVRVVYSVTTGHVLRVDGVTPNDTDFLTIADLEKSLLKGGRLVGSTPVTIEGVQAVAEVYEFETPSGEGEA